MPTDTITQPPAPAEGTNIPTGQPGVEEILRNAQSEMAKLLEVVETARTGAAESQRLAATALTDAQSKLAEITAVATGAAESQKLIVAAHADAQTKLSEITSTGAEFQKMATTTLSGVQTKLSEITDVATQAVAAKTKIADDQAVIAMKSDHIQKAQEHADKVGADLDRALTAATKQATAAEGQNSRAQTTADNTATLLAEIQKSKALVETDAAAIVTARKTSEDSTAQIKGLADKSAEVEKRIANYEQQLAELELQCSTQLKNITDLLPGATSAGLAHAFDDRRQTFLKPHDRWQWIFVGSLAAIIVLALTGLWSLHHTGANGIAITPTFDEVLRTWLSRLPVAGALVWLALHASREAALAKRLEEDYGYKSAVASSFLGFHKQMTEIGSASDSNAPLAKLCEDTLTTIASPPGRIYEKHKLTVTPADQVMEVTKAAANIVNPTTSPPK